MFDELAKTYFATKADYERGIELLRQYKVAKQQYVTWSDMEENFLLNLDDSDDHLLDLATALVRERGQRPDSAGHERSGLSQEDLKRLAEFLQSRGAASPGTAPEVHSLHSKPVSEAFKEFIAEKRHGWKSTNGSEGQYTEEVFPLFLELNGDLETAKINKTHTTAFANAVLSLPKKRRKMPEYGDLTIRALTKLSIPKEKQLSNTAKRNYLQRLSRFLHWLEDHDYSQRNLYAPLKSPSLRKVARANEERARYTDAELAMLFNSDDYTQGLHKYAISVLGPTHRALHRSKGERNMPALYQGHPSGWGDRHLDH